MKSWYGGPTSSSWYLLPPYIWRDPVPIWPAMGRQPVGRSESNPKIEWRLVLTNLITMRGAAVWVYLLGELAFCWGSWLALWLRWLTCVVYLVFWNLGYELYGCRRWGLLPPSHCRSAHLPQNFEGLTCHSHTACFVRSKMKRREFGGQWTFI